MNSKEKIYNAAKRLYIEQGYSETPNTQIASEAGVNLGLVTYYYKTKDILAGNLLNENFDILYSYISKYVPEEDYLLTLITFSRLSAAISMIDSNFDRFIYEMNKFDLVEKSIRTGGLSELYHKLYFEYPSHSGDETKNEIGFECAITSAFGAIRNLTIKQHEETIALSQDAMFRYNMGTMMFMMKINIDDIVLQTLINSASMIVDRIIENHPELQDVRNFLYI